MKKSLLLTPFLWTLATASFAQETLGDLIQAGAKKLAVEEVKSVVIGARATGPGRRNTTSDVILHPDGKATGYVMAGGRSFAIVNGTYKIENDGKVCLHYEFMEGIPPYDGCVAYFQKDTQYYLAYSDTDPKAEVVKRSFQR